MKSRWDVCNKRLRGFSPSRFLEIGTKAGRGARMIVADWKIGVDPYPAGDNNAYTCFYKLTSDEFFAQQKGYLNLSVVLIDGLHLADQVERDILNAISHLNPLGTVVVHDCNPPDEGSQIVPRQQVHWNGDGWKTITMLRATRSDLRVYTLDTDEGLGIVEWSRNERRIPLPGELTWDGLVLHRTEWLGLVEP